MTNVFVKHWRLVVLALGIILFLLVLYWLRTFVLPFAIGLILAYLLRPVVLWLEKHLPPRRKWAGFRRAISVLIALLLIVVVLAGFLYTVLTVVIDATLQIIKSTPYFLSQSIYNVQQWIEGVIGELPISIQEEIGNTFIEGGLDIGKSIRSGLLKSIPSISTTFNIILGFAVLPFFLFYLLKDSEKLKAGIRSALSDTVATHARKVLDIIEGVLGRYLKSQILLGF
ncbi:MAG: AI-2E family transporter, partial [Dehalococcoidales bacterium]|nr:AI-2E family transporter [Dehalococcoidales bacterium]